MKLKNIIFILSLFFVFNACDDDTNPVLSLPEKYTLETLTTNKIVLTEDNLDENVLTLNWKGDNTVSQAPMKYAIQIDVLDNEFKTAKILEETTELSYAIKGSTLNDFVAKNFGQEPGTSAGYDIRIVGLTKGKDNVSLIQPSTASDSQLIVITTTESKSAPEVLYMIGIAFGGFNWDSEGVVEMTPVNNTPGEFWTVKYIKAGEGFKWAPKKEWKNDFFSLGEMVGYTEHEGNAVVDKDGLYMIYINYLGGIITIEEAQISGMGDCFGGWTEGTYPFEISKNLVSIKTKNAGELRICAGSSATATEWWQREFIIINGKIEYRGNGPDQERVKVEVGQTVTLDFNANTGTIK